MTLTCRKALRIFPALILCVPLVAHAQDVETTLDNTAQILARAFRETRSTPIADTRGAGQIISALRSSRDKDTLPLFDELRKSSSDENRIYGMIAEVIVANDPQKLDVDQLLADHNPALVASAVAALLEANLVTTPQLRTLMQRATDPTLKAMAVGELDERKELKDRSQLQDLLKSDKDVIRYYAATTILEGNNPDENAAALQVLHEMSDTHNLRMATVQAMMLVRIQKENIAHAGPWVAQIAADTANDDGLRYTAVGTLLALKHPEGPRILASMIQSQHEVAQQVKLGLIALEYAPQLKPETMDPLTRSQSQLVSSIGKLAEQSARGTDVTAGMVKLIAEGHPILLDWALAYSDRCDKDRRLQLLRAIIQKATIVDEVRGRDYERAAIATQKLLEFDGKEGRAVVASLLRSGNRAVTEAALAGIYRSTAPDQSDLVLPVWDTLRKTHGYEMAANYAALILARGGHKEVSGWLTGMVMGGTIDNPGFRGLAGWYLAKLQGKSGALIQQILAG